MSLAVISSPETENIAAADGNADSIMASPILAMSSRTSNYAEY
eukprot:gene24000-9573_t